MEQVIIRKVLAIMVVLVLSVQPHIASRVLHGDQSTEELVKKSLSLFLVSLQKGPVNGSTNSPCTYVPGNDRANCPIHG
uniref:Uncharacterized protein n=1 Tax=Nelumbo nucifera TaxID=4432 RepID=A0A822XHE7_NELNU|nr:TPA_asm: hypothetical protein HUJ06_021273 [Nelumbo nucifera]